MSNAPTALSSIVLDNSRCVATVPVGDLKHPPNWVRHDTGTKEELIALARSYQARPINLILISPDGEVRDGNRRVAGIMEDTGPATPVMVCITEEEITPAVMLEIQIESAEHTKSLTGYEQFVGYSEWLRITGKTAKELGEKIQRDPAQVSRIRSLAKCIPEAVEAAKAGKLDVSGWYAISKLPPEDQPGLLALKLSGQVASRNEMEQHARKTRNTSKRGDTDTVKLEKLPIALSAGVVVIKVEKGKEALNLAAARKLLDDARAKVDKAISDGLSAKTAVQAWDETKNNAPKPRKPRVAKESA